METYYFKLRLFIILLFAISSCTNQDSISIMSARNVKTSNKKYALELKFDKPNTFEFYSSNSYEFKQEISNNNVVTYNTIETKVVDEIKTDSIGNSIIKCKYKEFKTRMKMNEEEKNFDASEAVNSLDPTERVFGAFNNAEFQIQISKNGEVKNVQGLDKVINKMYGLANNDPNALQVIHSISSQYLNQEYLKHNVEQQFHFLPDHPIQIGESWVIFSKLSSDMDVEVPTSYKLEYSKNGILYINVYSQMNIKDKQIKTNGQDVTLNLEGEKTGEIRIDSTSNIPIYNKTKQQLTGKISTLLNSIPVEINNKYILTTRKIK